jgi:DNA (cytosine-5)-methyltransferase 1
MEDPAFRFVDLFAGIGGLRIPFDQLGGICVFTSERDGAAKQVYQANFEHSHEFNDDITKLDDTPEAVPDHELLLAGFPCQPFSNAGKKLGFDDTRGTLFFSIANIARAKGSRVLILENVRGLISHDNGKTFSTIRDVLEGLGYEVHHQVLNARDFGLPQNRNRLFVVAILRNILGSDNYEFPLPTHERSRLRVADVLDDPEVEDSLTISDRLWLGHQNRKIKNRSLGKGFGYQIVTPESHYTATLSARYFKDGSEILIEQPLKNPRMLSVREAANLQGFPDEFKLHPSRNHAYKQLGNAVPVAVVSAIAKSVLPFLSSAVE